MELNYITESGNIDTKLFKDKMELDSFIFSDNDIIIIYIYDYSTHSYDYVGNFDEIFNFLKLNIGLKVLENLLKKECD